MSDSHRRRSRRGTGGHTPSDGVGRHNALWAPQLWHQWSVSADERSFSAMRRLKTYLWSTMSTERLNSVMTLHVYQDLLDCIDHSAVVKDFVACKEVWKDIFGKGLNLPAPLDMQWLKCFQLQGGEAPLTRGSVPEVLSLNPTGGSAPRPPL